MHVVPMCLWGKAQKDPRSDPYISACLGTKSTQHVQPQRGYFGAAWHWHRLQRHPLRDKVARFLGFAKIGFPKCLLIRCTNPYLEYAKLRVN